MKFTGGYNIVLDGKPSAEIECVRPCKSLFLPLQSKNLNFSEICIEDGQQVLPGQILGTDPENFDVPLLAPAAGKALLNEKNGHIVIENADFSQNPQAYDESTAGAEFSDGGVCGLKRHKLVSLGAWQFVSDAHTGKIADPLSTPDAVIVSVASFEPHVACGEALLDTYFDRFKMGLESLQSLLEYERIYLAVPEKSPLISRIHTQIRGDVYGTIVAIPKKYGNDNLRIIARHLDLKADSGPVWELDAEGVLAVESALKESTPCIKRIISIGGPAVKTAIHLEVPVGYPIADIAEKYADNDSVRMISGGMLTGNAVTDAMQGVDAECNGITMLPAHTEREFLGWLRPGWDRSSYSNSFLSSLRKKFSEHFSDTMRGEVRPCISCNFCEDVCPAGITPHLIHKYMYADQIDDAAKARVDLCVKCGLCSFVCTSKIDLTQEFIEAQETIKQEKLEAEKEQKRREEIEAQHKSVEENA
jgi:Na(+)-translocating NADH:ubiquinone oxidoreductase A subunit